ncbi:MAG: prolyl oligopeptidase family serine peptidase [Verrucomicrobiia bacterium]
MALIEEIAGRYRVDRRRIYLTGLSMGGYGVWSLATSHPEVFAAVVPICGGGDPADVGWMARQKPGAFASIGVWAFHGAEDKVVPLSESQDMVNAFKKAGGQDISLTVYEGTGHDAWAKAYEDPKLYEWLLQHRRD